MDTIIEKQRRLSRSLKGICETSVLQYLKEDFFGSSYADVFVHGQLNEDGSVREDADPEEYISAMDRFILFGKTNEGRRVLDVILSKKSISKEEKEVLLEWRDRAFESVFEVLAPIDGGLRLLDVVAEVEYDVYGNDMETLPRVMECMLQGYFVNTRIAPVQGTWFFSGTQAVLPPSAEGRIFETYVLRSSVEAQYRNNPEKRSKSFKMQKEQYDFFVDLFGDDEIIVSGSEVFEKQREFFRGWSRHMGSDSTPVLQALDSEEKKDDLQDEEGVGLLMDPEDGFYTVFGYGEFQAAFLDPLMSDTWRREIILDVLEEESTPALCFRRICERYPDRFREVMAVVLPDFAKKHDPVDDFSVLMDRYKPEWRSVAPSVSMMNERFRRRYYDRMHIGRNDPCPCESPGGDGQMKKYKQCCGK